MANRRRNLRLTTMELALAALALLGGCGPKQGGVTSEPTPADPAPVVPEAAPSEPTPAEPTPSETAPIIPEAEPGEPAAPTEQGDLEVLPFERPCMPRAVYGPRPCHSDEECVEENGEGWYCDKDHSYDGGCGERAVWPICARRE